jgi:hypothetical protein
MGYTTEFDGSVSISPPLNADEIAYLRKFAASRRMDRARGPYFVDGSGPFGQGPDGDIRNFNQAQMQPEPGASPPLLQSWPLSARLIIAPMRVASHLMGFTR